MSRPLLKLGGGLGGILRDLLLQSITEAKALISGTEGSDERRHVGVPLQAPKALGGFEDAGGDPAQHHLAAPPARDVTLHVTGPADEALDGVRRSERALEPGREVQRQDGHRLLEPFPHTGGCSGMLPVEAACEVPKQPRGGRDILALIRPPENRLHPGPLTLWQVVEDVAGLVDLATLPERGTVEHRGDCRPQCLRPIEHHQDAPIGAQAAALEVGQQALTDGRVLRRAFPETEGVLRAVGPDTQRDDQTVLADVDAVEHEADQIQVVEGRRLPRGELGRRLGDEAAADGALAHASTGNIERQRLQTPRRSRGC